MFLNKILGSAIAALEDTFDVPLNYQSSDEPCPTPIEIVIVSRRTPDEVESELIGVQRSLAKIWTNRRAEFRTEYDRKVMDAPKYGGKVFGAILGPNPQMSRILRDLEKRQKELEREYRFAVSYENNPQAYHQ